MPNICKHGVRPFANQNPSSEEINKFRLWKCDDCNKWYSLHDESEERALENDCFVITEEHLKYLDVLYNANVMGIGALQNQFEIDKDTARDVLKLWVNTFEKRHKREV